MPTNQLQQAVHGAAWPALLLLCLHNASHVTSLLCTPDSSKPRGHQSWSDSQVSAACKRYGHVYELLLHCTCTTYAALTPLLVLSTCSAWCVCAGLGKGFGGKGLDDVMNTEELVGEEDIEAALQAPAARPRSRAGSSNRGDSGSGSKARSATPPESKQAAASLLRSESIISARERNKLKRKAKALGRQESSKPGALDAKGRVSSRHAQQQASAHAECCHNGRTCAAMQRKGRSTASTGLLQLQLCVGSHLSCPCSQHVSCLGRCAPDRLHNGCVHQEQRGCSPQCHVVCVELCVCCCLRCRWLSWCLASEQAQLQAAGRPAQPRPSSMQQLQQQQQAVQQALALSVCLQMSRLQSKTWRRYVFCHNTPCCACLLLHLVCSALLL